MRKAWIKILMFGFFFLLCHACSNSIQKKTNKVLSLSEQNSSELEKVLSYYEEEPEKRISAEFLISNLDGNFSYDTTYLCKYRSFLLRYDSLRSIAKQEKIDALGIVGKEWNEFIRTNNVQSDLYSRREQDMHHLSSKYLIDNIETAFNTWQHASFKDSVNFDAFLKYVLPYRKKNGYVIEGWRHYFLSQYSDYAAQFNSPHELVDSLMAQLTDYSYTGGAFGGYPYLCLNDYLIGRISHCETQCWFNSMLFSALGVPCTIDYVPAWGNRNGSHEWNAIVVNGKTYPFEASGGRGKWKSGKVYNNVWVDEYWMKSRLPKVLRHSYHSIEEGPLTSEKTNLGNTPLQFLNPKYEDVSNEYFATSDIKIPVKKGFSMPDADFAYLCVFNEDHWKPIYWGEVSGSEVSFQKMGRDIVYLPVFYDNGRLIPFNQAFILQQDGSVSFLNPDPSKLLSINVERKYDMRPEVRFWSEWNKGAQIEVANNRSFKNSRIIFNVPECKPRPNTWKLEVPEKCRYVRYVFPEDKNVLAELSFEGRSMHNQPEGELKGNYFCSFKAGEMQVEKLCDGDVLTFADLSGFAPEDTTKCWVGIDFGKEVELTSVNICPRNDKNNVMKGMEYELFYWNDQWISLGKKVAKDYQLEYNKVPSNALLIMKCTTEGRENRIFTWKNKIQKWW